MLSYPTLAHSNLPSPLATATAVMHIPIDITTILATTANLLLHLTAIILFILGNRSGIAAMTLQPYYCVHAVYLISWLVYWLNASKSIMSTITPPPAAAALAVVAELLTHIPRRDPALS